MSKCFLITLSLFLVSEVTGQNLDFGLFNSLEKVNFYNIEEKKPVAIIFYSPDCPICIQSTVSLKEMFDEFGNEINWFLLYPGTYHTSDKITKFHNKYKLRQSALRDTALVAVRSLNAKVTPEVFLFKGSGQLIYHGKINNQFEGVGKRRTKATEHYLKDAIKSVLNNNEIKIKSTEAVGCFISR